MDDFTILEIVSLSQLAIYVLGVSQKEWTVYRGVIFTIKGFLPVVRTVRGYLRLRF